MIKFVAHKPDPLCLISAGIVCVLIITGSQVKKDSPVDIGTRLELFIDDYLIGSLNNARLEMHVPVDKGPVLFFDKPWEGPFSAYTTVIRDSDKYRMYYRGLPAASGEGTGSAVTCYAESKDGINWEKPGLKLFEVNGSFDNNIVLKDAGSATHNFSPFLDEKQSGHINGRFKALGGTNDGLTAFSSDDGIQWKKLSDTPVMKGESFDSQNVSFWSENEGCYVCYLRKWVKSGAILIRSIGRSTSSDFLHWSLPVTMDFGDSPAEELYTNQTSPYYRAPHIYIALAARFIPGKQVISVVEAKKLGVDPAYFHDCSDAVLMTSRGGNRYNRTFMEGFLRPGIGLNNWVSRTNYPALNVVQTGETEMSFYVNQDYAQPSAHLRRYALRIDGFSSLSAGYEPGELISRLIMFEGSKLAINFSTSAAGYILIELLDSRDNVLRDYSYEVCIPLVGNEIHRIVEWQAGSDLSQYKGIPVKLHFKLKDADLYSFRFE